MARFPLFFVLAAIGASAMIGIAAMPALPKGTQAADGKKVNGSIVFDAKQLGDIAPSRGFPVMPLPGPRGDQEGPRLAAVSALAPDAAFSKGARLVLGPQSRETMTGKALEVIVFARALANNPAPKMALGLVGEGPVTWQEADVSSDFQAIRFSLPAAPQPPQAIAFWASTQGQGQGIEIKSMTITPVTQGSAQQGVTP